MCYGKFTIASEVFEVLYYQKELAFAIDCLMGKFAHSGASISTKHLVLVLQAPCTNTTSTLYCCYKHLALTLQAPCTGTTSILYRHYKVPCTNTTKYLVLALLRVCSDCTEDFRSTASACCAQIRDKYMRALQPLRWLP